jgi:hypothetical protein
MSRWLIPRISKPFSVCCPNSRAHRAARVAGDYDWTAGVRMPAYARFVPLLSAHDAISFLLMLRAGRKAHVLIRFRE